MTYLGCQASTRAASWSWRKYPGWLFVSVLALVGCDRSEFQIEELSFDRLSSFEGEDSLIPASTMLGSSDGYVCMFRPYTTTIPADFSMMHDDRLEGRFPISEFNFVIVAGNAGKIRTNYYNRTAELDVRTASQHTIIHGSAYQSEVCGEASELLFHLSTGNRGPEVDLVKAL